MSPKTTQSGHITISKGSWVLRWRENVALPNGSVKRKLKFRALRTVTPTDRRHKRKDGELIVPQDVKERAAEIVKPLNVSETIASRKGGRFLVHTIATVVEKLYFPSIEVTKKPSTLKGYKDVWRNHLRDRIGKKLLHEFRRHDAFDLWEAIRDDNPHLTRMSLSHTRTFLSAIFKWAKDRGLYVHAENPASASLPDGLKASQPTKKYTVAETKKLLEALVGVERGVAAQAAVALAFGGGLRKGEILATRWEWIESNDDGATIQIRQSCWNGHFTEPKTSESTTTQRIDSYFFKYLTDWRVSLGEPTEGLVFPGNKKRPLDLHNLERRVIMPALRRCAICKMREDDHSETVGHEYVHDKSFPNWRGWHSLRRSNATYLAKKLGLDAATLSLRHSVGSGVTDKHYVLDAGKKQDRKIALATQQLAQESRKHEAAKALGAAMRDDDIDQAN